MINKCLLLIPHQDDETHLAGYTLNALHRAGVEIFVLYSTNGDWKYPADIRIKEAKAALKCLCDIRDDHILLLGYGDAYNNENHTHCFYADNTPAISASGHSETYGACGINDYAYSRKHAHSPYIKQEYVNDLACAISDIEADLLICVDLDEHPDHRMLSLCFEEAMGTVLFGKKNYHPVVWKGFAYCNAYTAADDFYSDRLNETVRPMVGVTEKYKFDLIDTSIYRWEDRIQVHVSPEFSRRYFLTNIKAKALSRHKSQYVILRAGRIINADEIFWQRRTDSVSYTASVSAESGNAKRLKDFHLIDCNEIDSENPDLDYGLWSPDDGQKEAVFEWKTPQEICSCRLYGNIAATGRIKKIRIEFSNGFEIMAGPLPERGNPLCIDFEPQTNIRSVKIRIVECEGTGWGISECEFYADQQDDRSASLAEYLSYSGTQPVDRSLFLTRTINNLYLAFVRVDKFLHRAIRFARKKGFRGLVKKLGK